jgi:hypothetical protein
MSTISAALREFVNSSPGNVTAAGIAWNRAKSRQELLPPAAASRIVVGSLNRSTLDAASRTSGHWRIDSLPELARCHRRRRVPSRALPICLWFCGHSQLAGKVYPRGTCSELSRFHEIGRLKFPTVPLLRQIRPDRVSSGNSVVDPAGESQCHHQKHGAPAEDSGLLLAVATSRRNRLLVVAD